MSRITLLILIVLTGCVTLRAQNVPRPNIPAPKGFTVNSYSGNIFYQRTDLTLRGVGFPLYATFYYNAVADTADYGYGKGWGFYYGAFYRDSANMVIIEHNDAKKDTFRLSGAAYISPTGVFDTLLKSGNIYTLRDKEGVEQVFGDPSHKKLTGIKDRNGNHIAITYTGKYPSHIRNSTGRCLILEWQNSHLISVSDSSMPSKKYTYGYDNSNMATVTNPLKGSIAYTYQRNAITRFTDENGNPVVFIYYPGGRVKQISSCNSTQQFNYIQALRQTFASINSSAGNSVTAYAFDENGKLIQVTTPDNKTYKYSYDEQNNLVQVQMPGNKTTTFTYDKTGNLLTETDALGFSTTYTYTSLNKIASITDKLGHVSSFGYDVKGNLSDITRPGSIKQSFTYNAQGQKLTQKDANGNTTSFAYNTDGDLVKVQMPVGTQLYEYGGGCCNLSKITDANGNSVNMTYDILNRLSTLSDDLGNTTTYQYDAAGNLTRETDPNGNNKYYSYDASNRLTAVQIPVGTWQYAYDGAGNFISMRDAKGNLYRYTYDVSGRLMQETDPLGNATNYAYDDNGNLVRKTEPKGNVVSFKYDQEAHLVERSYPGNTDKYSYDANGQLVGAANNNITYSLEYDALGQLIKKSIPSWNKAISYTYDKAGNRATMTDPDGGTNTYTYDANNRLIKLVNYANLTTTFAYDNGGRLTRQNNANGTYALYRYDNAGRVDSIIHMKVSGDTIAYNFYTFDKFGNRLTMRDKRGLNVYTYDGAQRLSKVIYGDGSTETFELDANGNRTVRTKNGVPTSYAYNAADQISSAGPASYSFDANGNMISNTETGYNRIFNYDGLNRLTDVQVTANKKWQVKYDPFGEKIEKVDTFSMSARSIFDGQNVLEQYNGNNIVINKYTQALNLDSWLILESNKKDYYYHGDGNNNTMNLTDNKQIVVNDYTYDAYGVRKVNKQDIPNVVCYGGRIYDEDIRFYDLRSRYYNPITSTFLTKDHFQGYVTLPTTINRYAYTSGNPILFIDPDGYVAKEYHWDPQPIIDGHEEYNAAMDKVTRAAEMVKSARETAEAHERYNQQIINNTDPYDVQMAKMHGVTVNDPTDARPSVNDQLKAYGVSFVMSLGPKELFSYLGYQYDPTDVYASSKGSVIEGIKSAVIKVPKKLNENYTYIRNGAQEAVLNISNLVTSFFVNIFTLRSADPNAIYGANGYDTAKKWVSVNSTIPYKISFENDPKMATAPAQKVIVYCPVDAKLNPGAFRLGGFGFGSFNFTVPDNVSTYTNRLDVRDSLGVFVDVTAGLDITSRRAFWIFESIDPATGLSTTVPPDKGFLPINDTAKHNGEGFVNFTIQPSVTANTGDSIVAKASIVFDSNDTIPTNSWRNTIDAVAPASKVAALPATNDSTFTVSWTGKDDNGGVGVATYDLYYSKNSGPFTAYKTNIDSAGIVFTGDKGAAYSFYTLATDYTGNKEAAKTKAEATTTIAGNGVSLDIKVFLQGPYDPAVGMMTDSLRKQALLPFSQPYTALGFTAVNNSLAESVVTGVLDSTGINAVVDWLWVELRSGTDFSKIVSTRSALLTRSGKLVDLDGHSPVYFNNISDGNYFVSVRHRNHLGIMTASKVSLNRLAATAIDFTSASYKTYGSNAQVNINGVMAMWAGDTNGDGKVSFNGADNDKNIILAGVGVSTPNSVVAGYNRADANMDGKTTYNGARNDKNRILANAGILTPNNIIQQQLPK